MWINLIVIIIGLGLLTKAADWFVIGSSALARKLQVSELTIGLTIVAFGTSAPELVVNCFASLEGNNDIVFGNILGSNGFNLFIILSIVGLIAPVKLKSSTASREIPISLIVLIILFLLANDQMLFNREISHLGRIDALFMLACFSMFIFYVFRKLKDEDDPVDEAIHRTGNWRIAMMILAGLIGLVMGGKLVLDHAVKLATELGLSEKVIGLTIVAAGTSFPELATSIVAAAKKNHDIAVGNIIGSNIFNVLFIIPVSAMIRPLDFDTGFNVDIAFIAGGTILVFLAMYTGRRRQIDRWEALILLASYVTYMVFLLK